MCRKMRKFCANLRGENGLETILEVPIPEEMFPTKNKSPKLMFWKKSKLGRFSIGDRNSQIQVLLGVIGAPLVHLPIHFDNMFNKSLKNYPIESSMAKYIISQYIAAVGGAHALNSVDSMYAMGKVKIMASEFNSDGVLSANNQNLKNSKKTKVKGRKHGAEVGGFVLWSKRPELWCLELVVSGTKIIAGCDGKVTWRQTPWHNSHASRGPRQPLRRSLLGLDPRLTANFFTNSICIGERRANGEDCFVLKLEANPKTMEARSSIDILIIRHSILGYFSQKTGLLVQLDDSQLLGIKTSKNNYVYWETTMESSIHDYRTVDGINIAHSGRTSVSFFRCGEMTEDHSKTRLEEIWSIEEVEFNIQGLTMDCFLPPANLNTRNDGFPAFLPKSTTKTWTATKHSDVKVVVIDDDGYS
ncbi:hypothetical protein RND81_08G213100 [Saponaria officinalis]|uniref:Uncharacterized protein n=1 Tax=Saponaria officinalis TaxID=3572 RepID=A0AAW1JBN3_SAPOF